jgi:hypothetical protein
MIHAGAAHSVESVSVDRPAERSGWLPVLAIVMAIGVLLVALADARSRAGDTDAELLFWTGILLLVSPATARLASVGASRRERLGLVVFFGLSLYLVKVMHSPVAFTYPDELIMFFNTKEILNTGVLFNRNPILPVTPFYPGIALAAATLGELSGLATFGAALLLMGAARVILVLSLFFLHEQVSGSSRIAGIAAVLYAANPNFVFVGAGFTYESLALPLAAMALFAIARRGNAADVRVRVTMTVAAILTIMAVVVTHHMTSWALLSFLLAVSAFSTLQRVIAWAPRSPARQPLTWGLTALCGILVLSWVIHVAVLTIGYLAPVFRGALGAVLRLIVSTETARLPFQSTTGEVAPLAERFLGVGSILLILIVMPLGLWQVYSRYRTNAFALTLAGAALIFIPMLGLRFTPAGWETGNRSSEFLYVGISFVLALALVELRPSVRIRWLAPVVIAGYVTIIFSGGIISSFPRALRLPPPYQTSVDGQVIEPEGVVAARWTHAELGPGRRFAASNADANLLLAYGEQDVRWGANLGLQSMFLTPILDKSVLDILRTADVEYVVTNRRRISWDLMFGLYATSRAEPRDPAARFIEPEAMQKFDNIDGSSRIFDSGDIVIYDVEGVNRRAGS